MNTLTVSHTAHLEELTGVQCSPCIFIKRNAWNEHTHAAHPEELMGVRCSMLLLILKTEWCNTLT